MVWIPPAEAAFIGLHAHGLRRELRLFNYFVYTLVPEKQISFIEIGATSIKETRGVVVFLEDLYLGMVLGVFWTEI
jgi:hypothetical protein